MTKVVLMLAALAVLLVFHMWASARPRRLWYLGAITPVIWLGVLIWMAVTGVFRDNLLGLLFGGLAPMAVLLGIWTYGREAADAREAAAETAGDAAPADADKE